MYSDLFIAGLAHRLPARLDVEEAVQDGRYDADEQAANEYAMVSFADGETPPEMAVHAARLALERSGVAAADVALLLHASAWFQGLTLWPSASYVHRNVLAGNRHAPAQDVQQMSNSTMGAIELAASYLAADPSRSAALITTADRFESPGIDRWSSDLPGIVYGDGGAAAVLARRGVARLVSLATVTDTGLEAMYRGDEPFEPWPGRPVDVRTRRQAFQASGENPADRLTEGFTEAVERTLAEAGTKLSDVARFVFPNVGLKILRTRYLAPLGLDLSVSTWEWGRNIGHVSASDQLTGLTYLLETGQVQPGDLVMLIGIGAGFCWSGALLEVTERPGWV